MTPPKPHNQSAATRRLNPLQAWFLHHLYGFFSSLGQLSRTPLPTLMTSAVIGIALALPAGLYLLLENAMQVSQGWDASVQISLFLKNDISDERAEGLAKRLEQQAEIDAVRVISREQALQEYRRLSGFSDALSALDENPLPAVLVVKPVLGTPDATQTLLQQLGKIPDVEIAQYDMRWLKRLFSIIGIIKRGVIILASLLALAVLLVVGNTIRLAIYNRRDEIEVTKLFGATNAFIRRPFLYTGVWHGLLGGIIAWIMVALSFAALQEPVRQLSALYHSDYNLISLTLKDGMILIGGGALLGLAGAWLAVGRHLQGIQAKA